MKYVHTCTTLVSKRHLYPESNDDDIDALRSALDLKAFLFLTPIYLSEIVIKTNSRRGVTTAVCKTYH